jgi:hypothetical protein
MQTSFARVLPEAEFKTAKTTTARDQKPYHTKAAWRFFIYPSKCSPAPLGTVQLLPPVIGLVSA